MLIGYTKFRVSYRFFIRGGNAGIQSGIPIGIGSSGMAKY